MITESLRQVITDAGLTPDHLDLTLLSAAIQSLSVVEDASATVKGKVELATDGEAQAGTDEYRAITPKGLAAAMLGGVGQTWQDVAASRASGVTYTNSTGRPIEVLIGVYDNSGSGLGNFYINDTLVVYVGNSSSNQTFDSISAVIPNGSTYKFVQGSSSATFNFWNELR